MPQIISDAHVNKFKNTKFFQQKNSRNFAVVDRVLARKRYIEGGGKRRRWLRRRKKKDK